MPLENKKENDVFSFTEAENCQTFSFVKPTFEFLSTKAYDVPMDSYVHVDVYVDVHVDSYVHVPIDRGAN